MMTLACPSVGFSSFVQIGRSRSFIRDCEPGLTAWRWLWLISLDRDILHNGCGCPCIV